MTSRPPQKPPEGVQTWAQALVASLPVPQLLDEDSLPPNLVTLRTSMDVTVLVQIPARALASDGINGEFVYAGASDQTFDTSYYRIRLQRDGTNARFTIRARNKTNRINGISLRGHRLPVVENTPREVGLSVVRVSPLPVAKQFDFELEVSGSEVIELIDVCVSVEVQTAFKRTQPK